ncbi:hypothetical protein H4R34_001080 [Dimargaris verticillata]|uniref:Uncharacterized protein n=1 Tax=Dimargaris verticillata TaxID=2761393 RepID=A0A9W8EAM9_9FUNG|nr:hypothetical protein H4R34_001080 [Dimargaris verticillata]
MGAHRLVYATYSQTVYVRGQPLALRALEVQVETNLTDLFDRLCMATASNSLSPLGSQSELVEGLCGPAVLMSSLTLSPWPSPVSSPALKLIDTCTDWDSEASTLASEDDSPLGTSLDTDFDSSFDSDKFDDVTVETTSDDGDWSDAMDQLVVRLESCALSAHPYRPMAAYSILMEIV